MNLFIVLFLVVSPLLMGKFHPVSVVVSVMFLAIAVVGYWLHAVSVGYASGVGGENNSRHTYMRVPVLKKAWKRGYDRGYDDYLADVVAKSPAQRRVAMQDPDWLAAIGRSKERRSRRG